MTASMKLIEKGLEKLRGNNVLLSLNAFAPTARFMPLDLSWWAEPTNNVYKLPSRGLYMGRLLHPERLGPSEIVEGLRTFFRGVEALINTTPPTSRPPNAQDFPVGLDVDWNALLEAQKIASASVAPTTRVVLADLLSIHYEKDVTLEAAGGGGTATFIVATCTVGRGDVTKMSRNSLLHSFRL